MQTQLRARLCECGQHLEGSDDRALCEAVKTHIEQAHPGKRLTDEQVRELVKAEAYEMTEVHCDEHPEGEFVVEPRFGPDPY